MNDFKSNYGKSPLIDAYIDEAVAETLKELRISHNYSYGDLQRKMNGKCSRQTLNNYELGKSKLRMDMFKEFARVYNLKPQELYNMINLKYMAKLEKVMKSMDE